MTSAALATRNLRLSFVVSAPPPTIYAAWLDSAAHGAMTGQRAEIEPRTFGRFMAGDGYAEGVLLELDQNRRVVQTWRGNDFSKNSPDSRLEVRFESVGNGTRVTIEHDDVPEELAADIDEGWRQYYVDPMTAYFAARPRGKSAKPATKKKASAKKSVSKKSAAKKAVAKKARPKKAAKAKPAAKKSGAAKRVKKAPAKSRAKATAKSKSKSKTAKSRTAKAVKKTKRR